jgi:hypothetical protein
MDQINAIVKSKVDALIHDVLFKQWIKEQKLSPGDSILINNSFLSRDKQFIKTTKNSQFLCLKVENIDPFSLESVSVAEATDFKLDFKLISQKSKEPLKVKPLDDAILSELKRLGKLIFILIGSINQDKTFEIPIEHVQFDKIILDFNGEQELSVEGKDIIINLPGDEDYLWEVLQRESLAGKQDGTPLPESLKSPFQRAVKNIRENSCLALVLPPPGVEINNSLFDVMSIAIRKQIEEYEQSLKNCGPQLGLDYKEFNNVLRIAYNFSSDAVRVIKLLISVCDLKPIILWMTINEQIALLNAFQCIPGLNKTKPDLNDYISQVNGARNKAFHDLFPFRHTIEAELDGVSLSAKRMRFFSPFTAKSKNIFEFQDQQLVEILTEFTRAEEKYVDPVFWERNLVVMNATANLLESVASSLKQLYRFS